MEHGEIRVCRVNKDDHTDLSDYWILPMHDNYNGYIPKILLSHDNRMLLTCGHDGNLFSFLINDDGDFLESNLRPESHESPLPLVYNISDQIYWIMAMDFFCNYIDEQFFFFVATASKRC